MKIKLDENFSVQLVDMIEKDGHEVETVYSENLSGKHDEVIYQKCISEKRILFTLDLDFANPFVYPSVKTEGIIVFRPHRLELPILSSMLQNTLDFLRGQSVKGKLWIVEPAKIREYKSPFYDEFD